MIPKFSVWFIVLVFFEVIFDVLASTHWMVTEDGRIQPQVETVFDMRRPYDLITFLEQEKNKEAAITQYKKLVARKAVIDRSLMTIDSACDISDIENTLYSKDSDCLLAGKLLADIDLYESVVTDGSFRNGVTYKDFMVDDVVTTSKKKVPDCKSTFPLDFSIYTFEHLNAMKNRKNLHQPKEKSLMNHIPPGYDLKTFGHIIASGLLRNNTSWLHLNLAAIYWRIRGNAYDALECARRAIVTAPRQYRDIPLLTTAGIFHAARHSAEAAKILHVAIDHNSAESLLYLALGHVYAVLGDYNRSVACYDNCLKLTPSMTQAKEVKHAILCAQKLEKTLLVLHQEMQDTLSELRAYQNDQEEWWKLYKGILLELAIKPPLAELESSIITNHLLKTIPPTFGRVCHRLVKDDSTMSYNIIESKLLAENTQVEIDTRLRWLKNLDDQAKEVIGRINKDATDADPIWEQNTDGEKLRSQTFVHLPISSMSEATNVDKLKLDNIFKMMENILHSKMSMSNDMLFEMLFDQAHLWLANFYIAIGDLNLEPSILDNNGKLLVNPDYCQNVKQEPVDDFDIVSYLLELRNINIVDELTSVPHDTPEQQPFCLQSADVYVIDELHGISSEAQSEIKGLVRQWLFMITRDRTSTIEQLGTKIAVALQENSTSWTLALAASLYWRIHGDRSTAPYCFDLAVEHAPMNTKDVPILILASLLSAYGYYNEALVFAHGTLLIAPRSPISYYSVAYFQAALGNYEFAAKFYRLSLMVDPNFEPAASRLRSSTCSLLLDEKLNPADVISRSKS